MPAPLEPTTPRERARRVIDRLPSLKLRVGLAGPTADFDSSKRKQEETALLQLVRKMSERRILWQDLELEVEDRAYDSATDLLRVAGEARTDLPKGSQVDQAIEGLQDACNDFRTHMEQRDDGFPFGERLYDLRAAALVFAADAEEHFKLPEAGRLAAKIRMDTAMSPMGEETNTL